ncbi:DNA-binding protein [Jiella endophytica]|uniref:DNA-binding protein n=1 Tax=Jiella endophytica TaxID=2558362 RepID=A0A4Y8RNQ3_9HYPH|nr:DNA-binding protein [Jiella endophytica]TFF25293.1 DNA-binding protein [Jiella endophytica]
MSGHEPKPILTDDERDDYDLSENVEWVPTGDIGEDRLAWQTAARRALQDVQDQRIEVLISRRDLERLKSRAAKEGVPYQALIKSILHDYVEE